nr:MAG TPA: hypothetical protein [Caudoviricetes sp.]DAT53981.1 MAG TPA: hypothetical protein [Caudoviricetes sp.]
MIFLIGNDFPIQTFIAQLVNFYSIKVLCHC